MVYDVVIAGVGGMGSAAALHLARRGLRVLALERFEIPNAMGSSHGVNRIIRRTYYEHPDYVPLLGRAYELWAELEAGFGERLLHRVGGVDAGPEDGATFQGSLAACRRYRLAHEVLAPAALRARFPAYRLPPGTMALFQPDAGFVMSERAIVAHAAAARAAGAEIRTRECVLGWEARADRVTVRTDRGNHDAGRLVLTAGPWLETLAPELRGRAVPERQVLAWLQPLRPELFAPACFPVFNITLDGVDFYGFPVHAVPGFKFGRHHHRGEAVAAEDYDRAPHPEDEALLRAFAARVFPEGNGPALALQTCLYTNAPDEHFILGPLPGTDGAVLVVSPCSGHGFKFCPVIGEIVADLVTTGATRHDIGLFAMDRLGLAA